MHVELSERARQRVEELMGDGAYPSAEAVVEAALAQFCASEAALSAEQVQQLLAEGYADIEAGRVHPAEDVLAEARRLLEARSSFADSR